MREIAQTTGREVVRETLLAIGLDVADPVKLQRDFVIMREVGALAMDPEFRKDIEHTRKWRKAIEQVETKGFIAAVERQGARARAIAATHPPLWSVPAPGADDANAPPPGPADQ